MMRNCCSPKQSLVAMLLLSALTACAKVVETPQSPTPSAAANSFTMNPQVIKEVLRGGPRSGRVAVDMDDSQPNGHTFHSSIALSRDQTLYLAGWAYDELINAPCNAVLVTVGREKVLLARYGLERPDVARYFKNERLENSGYTISIPASSLGAGTHDVEVYCVAQENSIREGNRGMIVSVH